MTIHTILVTGASGFIGRYLVRYLKNRGCRVVAMNRHVSDGEWDDLILHDICRPISSPTEIPLDTIFHLAGKAHALSEHAGEEAEYDRYSQRP